MRDVHNVDVSLLMVEGRGVHNVDVSPPRVGERSTERHGNPAQRARLHKDA